MNNYYEETGTLMATGLDVTVLSPKTQQRLMQYMDQEGESAFREMIEIRHTVAAYNYAITAQSIISQNAMRESENVPYAADEIAKLVSGANRRLQQILEKSTSDPRRRWC